MNNDNSQRFFAAAFVAGLVAVAWVGYGFIGSANWLALTMTVVIAAAYLTGSGELLRFRRETKAFARALDAVASQAPTDTAAWLETVPAPLRPTTRARLDGERAALPAPGLAPYLVGLLVMLGMLGTFLGMVVTFKGAVFALQGSTDLQAIRAALAEPIRGLALSFGTSIAGVSASAMLGLMSALARRERLDAARVLDQRIAGPLRALTFAHQRDETFRALQTQAAALPAVAGQLEALLDRLEQRSRELDAHLLAGQTRFHEQATRSYEDLAQRVGSSLQGSLVAAATAAGDSIRPVVADTMAQLAEDARLQHAQLADTARAQVDALSSAFRETSTALAASFRDTSTALVADVGRTMATAQQDQAAREQDRLHAWSQSLETIATRLDAQWQALAQDTVRQMAALGGALEQPVQRLLQTASEVPASAAQVLARLQEEVGRSAERDNLALQERTLLLDKLGTVLQEVQQAAAAQRDAIDALVQSTTGVLQESAERFAQVVQTQAAGASDAATTVAASASDMGALAQAFGTSVQQFQATNDKVLGTLLQLEGTLQRSIERSDEQLAYYVAQAREVIDLSIASQADIVGAWRQLQGRAQAVEAVE